MICWLLRSRRRGQPFSRVPVLPYSLCLSQPEARWEAGRLPAEPRIGFTLVYESIYSHPTSFPKGLRWLPAEAQVWDRPPPPWACSPPAQVPSQLSSREPSPEWSLGSSSKKWVRTDGSIHPSIHPSTHPSHHACIHSTSHPLILPSTHPPIHLPIHVSGSPTNMSATLFGNKMVAMTATVPSLSLNLMYISQDSCCTLHMRWGLQRRKAGHCESIQKETLTSPCLSNESF